MAESEQAYEYKTVKCAPQENPKGPGATLNEYAKKGWELIETIEIAGTTEYFIFRQ